MVMTKIVLIHLVTKCCVSCAMLGAGDTQGSGTDMVFPFGELTLCRRELQNNYLQIMTSHIKEIHCVTEVLDIGVNGNDVIGKVE